MNETRNDTNRPPAHLSREAGPNDLTFRFYGGFAGLSSSSIVRLNGVVRCGGCGESRFGGRLPDRCRRTIVKDQPEVAAKIAAGYSADMTVWQYGQLRVTYDNRLAADGRRWMIPAGTAERPPQCGLRMLNLWAALQPDPVSAGQPQT
jgi:hypothetical protein